MLIAQLACSSIIWCCPTLAVLLESPLFAGSPGAGPVINSCLPPPLAPLSPPPSPALALGPFLLACSLIPAFISDYIKFGCLE